jgi:hypothetical protein
MFPNEEANVFLDLYILRKKISTQYSLEDFEYMFYQFASPLSLIEL